MNEDTKNEIKLVLTMLKKSLIDNGVSMGLKGNKIMFFDTDTYIRDKKFSGFSVALEDLVKGDDDNAN